MEITVGHTPDADDAFMFYGMATGKIRSRFSVKHVIEDIEALNNRALKHDLFRPMLLDTWTIMLS
jgi:1,4-dihydroxy-6-naphthoate synthase